MGFVRRPMTELAKLALNIDHGCCHTSLLSTELVPGTRPGNYVEPFHMTVVTWFSNVSCRSS